MSTETLIEDDRWETAGLDRLADGAIQAALAHRGLDPELCDVAVLGCDDARIAVLNADFRGKPQPTNVLSWPEEDLAPEDEGALPEAPQADPGGRFSLGDIALAYDTCAREAADQDKRFSDHTQHLLVHGLLHLLGYDHIRDGDAVLMEGIEIEILGRLGIDDPYRDHYTAHGPDLERHDER